MWKRSSIIDRELVFFVKHMASQLIKGEQSAVLLGGIMAGQVSVWLVMWLKCTENGQWSPVISDSDIGITEYLQSLQGLARNFSSGFYIVMHEVCACKELKLHPLFDHAYYLIAISIEKGTICWFLDDFSKKYKEKHKKRLCVG